MKRYDGDLIFVVTSDHGSALGDDESIGDGPRWRKQKKSLHDFNLRIPFAILPSDRVRGPVRIDVPASNVDFVPTLLAWLGVEPPVALPGVSFLPALQGGEPPADERALYARTSAFGFLTDCIVYRGRKYMRFFDLRGGAVSRREVFDLAADPRETQAVAADFGPVDGVLADAAGNRGVEYPARFEAPSSELTEQLRALGYLRDAAPDPDAAAAPQ
jgi:arylsulfatase A-like enzyme